MEKEELLYTYEELLDKVINLQNKNAELLHQRNVLMGINDRKQEKLDRIKSIYSSMQFSAPENMYIFIEQLGELLEEINESI